MAVGNRSGRARLAAAALVVALVGAPAMARAHPAPFSFLDLRLDGTGLSGAIVLHDLDLAHDLEITPPERLLEPAVAARLAPRIQALIEPRLLVEADGSRRRLEWTGIEVVPERFGVRVSFRAGARAARIDLRAVVFPYDPVHQTFVNVYEDGALRRQAILTADAADLRFFAGTTEGRLAVVRTFVASGIEHILIGPDHVLFLIGLLLLGGTLARLAIIVTAFTLGHSLTLSLAALDVLSADGGLIEPLIALTIVIVGTDNLFVLHERRRATTAGEAARPKARDARPLFAGAFGLIHGFGFASVLRAFGLPPDALAWSLVSFNVGVEIGQLAIVVVVAAALAAVTRQRPAAAMVIGWAGSILVILAGTWWFVERVFWSRP